MSVQEADALHVEELPCGCAQIEPHCGCSVGAVLETLGLTHRDTLCDRHRADYDATGHFGFGAVIRCAGHGGRS